MSIFQYVLFSSCSIAIAAFIGIARFQKVHSRFYPFIILSWASFLNEVITYVIIYFLRYGNSVSTNIFNFIEGLLWLWQLGKWNSSKAKRV